LLSVLGIEPATRNEDIEAGGAFEGGAGSDIEEAAAVRGGALAVSFRNVVRNGLACVIQVSPCAQSASRQGAFESLSDPGHECDARPVHIELFVVEHSHALLIGASTSLVSRFLEDESEQEHEHEQV